MDLEFPTSDSLLSMGAMGKEVYREFKRSSEKFGLWARNDKVNALSKLECMFALIIWKLPLPCPEFFWKIECCTFLEEVLCIFGGMNNDCGEWVMCLCGGPVACFCRRIQRTEVAAEYMFSPQGAFVVPHKELAQGAGLEFANATPDVRQAPGNTKVTPPCNGHTARGRPTIAQCCE